MTRINARLAAAGLLGASLLVLGGCSGSSDTAGTAADATSSSTSQPAPFNDADVMFAQMMIPHHQGAVQMSDLAPSRAQDQRVKDFAQRVKFAQDPEITMMTGWLRDWGKPAAGAASGGMGGMDHSGSADTGGMDLSMLQSASGRDFDRMWLQMMIEHHSSAVDMAETEIAGGENEHAVALAKQIADSQSGEIREMQSLLTELGS